MLHIYNTLIKTTEPLETKKLRLFVCGPTVYDYSHIGHAKTYVFFDAFTRYLRSTEYEVTYLQNITDVDDKIIAKAKEESKTAKEISEFFYKAYVEDMKALKVTSVDRYAKATEHLEEIISQVKRLLDKGYAYETDDGIYYDTPQFKEYGKLSGRTTEQAEDGVSRIDDSVSKRNKADFALWKFSSDEPNWKSPWGQGRPGWHIEDTAITEKYFGPQYEIHGGARDLLFPHHEAEIAQMEALSNTSPMARYWMHPGFLTVKGEKMSKSKGNFVTIRDFLEHHSPRLLRFLILKSHYSSPLDYTDELVEQSERELERIDEFARKLKEAHKKPGTTSVLQESREAFWRALEDDFNTPSAFAVLFEVVREANRAVSEGRLGKDEARQILGFLKEADAIFDCLLAESSPISASVRKLAEQRKRERESGNWEKADELRERLNQSGWEIEDTQGGQRLKRKT